MAETIRCRALLGDIDCHHGRPVAHTLGPDARSQSEDGTYDVATDTIVCTPCYAALMPFTPSGAATHRELPEAIRVYRDNLAAVRNATDDDLVVLRDDAREKATTPAPQGLDEPWQASCRAAAAMAQREIDRRKA